MLSRLVCAGGGGSSRPTADVAAPALTVSNSSPSFSPNSKVTSVAEGSEMLSILTMGVADDDLAGAAAAALQPHTVGGWSSPHVFTQKAHFWHT